MSLYILLKSHYGQTETEGEMGLTQTAAKTQLSVEEADRALWWIWKIAQGILSASMRKLQYPPV